MATEAVGLGYRKVAEVRELQKRKKFLHLMLKFEQSSANIVL